jgi:hypothetical protein
MMSAMETLRKGVIAALLLSSLFCSSQQATPPSISDTQWNNVKQMSHHTTFIFVARDNRCVWGRIKRADDSEIAVEPSRAHEVVIQRVDLFRITKGAWAPGVIFTARSSWFDVAAIVGKHLHPTVAVITTSGQQHIGKLLDSSNDNLSIESAGKMLDISKDEISSVSFVRPKPLSDSAAYADGELAWMKVFDPQLWPNLLHMRSAISVRLYDSSMPEDNSRVPCAKVPKVDVTRPAWPPHF